MVTVFVFSLLFLFVIVRFKKLFSFKLIFMATTDRPETLHLNKMPRNSLNIFVSKIISFLLSSLRF